MRGRRWDHPARVHRATRGLCDARLRAWRRLTRGGSSLRVCYAMPGTDIACATATRKDVEVSSAMAYARARRCAYWMTYACHLRDKTALKKAKEKEKADEEADGASRDKYKAKLRVFEAMTKSEFISTPEILELKALKEASLASKSALAGPLAYPPTRAIREARY
eukprot:341885-Rhodomonas_salina.1